MMLRAVPYVSHFLQERLPDLLCLEAVIHHLPVGKL